MSAENGNRRATSDGRRFPRGLRLSEMRGAGAHRFEAGVMMGVLELGSVSCRKVLRRERVGGEGAFPAP